MTTSSRLYGHIAFEKSWRCDDRFVDYVKELELWGGSLRFGPTHVSESLSRVELHVTHLRPGTVAPFLLWSRSATSFELLITAILLHCDGI